MTAPGEPSIVVRVEVQVPLTGTTPYTFALLGPLSKESADDFRITLPQNRVTPVRQTVSQPATGTICATGRAYRPSATSTVVAKVYQGILNPPGGAAPAVPSSPPPSDPLTQQTGTDANGYWQFPSATVGELGGAQCGPASGPLPNTLAVWAQFSSDPAWYWRIMYFTGLCSNHTECTSGGAVLAAQHQAEAIHAPAPRQWQVVAVGFQGAAEAFNKVWEVTRGCQASAPAVWDNGADGHTAPRVELRCDGDWGLTFRHDRCVIHYRKPAGEWKPLNANIFTGPPTVEGDCPSCPLALAVVPV